MNGMVYCQSYSAGILVHQYIMDALEIYKVREAVIKDWVWSSQALNTCSDSRNRDGDLVGEIWMWNNQNLAWILGDLGDGI